MAPCRAASARQLELILEFAEANRNLATGGLGGGPLGRQAALRKWEDLSRKLNSVGIGCRKTPMEWRRYWTLLKSRTKGKAGDLRRAATGTGGGPNHNSPLTPLEERLIALIGKVAVEGEPEVQISVNIPDLPTQPSTIPSPIEEIIIDVPAFDHCETISEDPVQNIETSTQSSTRLRNLPPLDEMSTSTQSSTQLRNLPPLDEMSTSTQSSTQLRNLPPLDEMSTSTQRRQPLRSVENAPQWAIDVENRRIQSHLKIYQELKEIKEGINRIADLLTLYISENKNQ